MRHLLGAEEPENCKHLRETSLILNSYTEPLVSLIWLTFLLALLPLCMGECICGLVNGLANSPSCLMGFCLFLSLITRKALTNSEHYLYFLWPLIYLNFATWHSSWFKIITRKEKLHVYLDAVLLYLESFFLELLPLALVKQNIMLQGSDEEWIFNELQIVLSKTLSCTTGPVCGLLRMLGIFLYLDHCSSSSYYSEIYSFLLSRLNSSWLSTLS